MGILDGILGGGGAGADATALISQLIGGHEGGLGGLLQTLERGGLGEVAQSWVSQGANLPISAAQIEGVLGSGPLAELAGKLGIDPQTAAAQIAQVLPQAVDHLTPDGQAPSGPLAALSELLGGLKL